MHQKIKSLEHRTPHLRPGPIANANNLVTTFETASVNNDSNLFLHSNVLRNNLIPLRSVFQTSYFKNSDLLYNITPMQILRKICCLYSLVELRRIRLHCCYCSFIKQQQQQQQQKQQQQQQQHYPVRPYKALQGNIRSYKAS